MKKITLLVFAFLSAFTADAAANDKTAGNNVLLNSEDPIAFIERGITFYVFTNGDFDFNTQPSADGDVYFRRNFQHNSFDQHESEGVIIEQDNFGRVRRIGNVFVNYDAEGRVKRIGTVYLNYYRAALVQIGGMRLIYDRRGRLINTSGSVMGRGAYAYQYHPTTYYNNTSPYNNDNYYYKTNSDKEKIEEKEVIKE